MDDNRLSLGEAFNTIKNTTTDAYNNAKNAVEVGKMRIGQAKDAYNTAKKIKQQRHILIE